MGGAAGALGPSGTGGQIMSTGGSMLGGLGGGTSALGAGRYGPGTSSGNLFGIGSGNQPGTGWFGGQLGGRTQSEILGFDTSRFI